MTITALQSPTGQSSEPTAQLTRASHPPLITTKLNELLSFRAPYLEKKLLRLGVVSSGEQAHSLFQEVKKYLVVSALQQGREIPMFSSRVDEAWHQFALFTRLYTEFCLHFAGRYVHHLPSEAPQSDSADKLPPMTLDEFRAAYEPVFGDFSDAWYDHLAVASSTRLSWSSWAVPLEARMEQGRALLIQAGEQPVVLCKVNLRALVALQFIAEQRLFFVRELPGLANHEERLALCRPLVQFEILRVAP